VRLLCVSESLAAPPTSGSSGVDVSRGRKKASRDNEMAVMLAVLRESCPIIMTKSPECAGAEVS